MIPPIRLPPPGGKGLFLFFWLLAPGFWILPATAGYEDALESYLKEDYVRAAVGFDRVVQKTPDDPRILQAMYYSAVCRLNLDDARAAAEILRPLLERVIAVDESPGSPFIRPPPSAIRLALGMALKKQGADTSALSYFESAWLSSSNAYERAAARDEIRRLVSNPPPERLALPPPPPIPAVNMETSPPTPKEDAAPPGSGVWAVQVVSTANAEQADSIFSMLQSAGWPVYRETKQVMGGSYIRVRAGPYASSSEANRARAQLRSKYGMEGWVTRK